MKNILNKIFWVTNFGSTNTEQSFVLVSHAWIILLVVHNLLALLSIPARGTTRLHNLNLAR